jgi:hypothetical protein
MQKKEPECGTTLEARQDASMSSCHPLQIGKRYRIDYMGRLTVSQQLLDVRAECQAKRISVLMTL